MKLYITNTLKRLFAFATLLALMVVAMPFLASHAGTNAVQPKCDAVKLAQHTHWNKAFQCAKNQNDKVLYKIVQWLKYRNRHSKSSFEEITRFINANPHFPDRKRLVSMAEYRLNTTTNKKKALQWFKKNPPSTSNGIKYYLTIYPYPANNKKNEYIKLVRQTWITARYTSRERKDFLAKYGKYLKTEHHIAKIDHSLKQGHKILEPDLMKLLSKDQQNLFKARLLILKNRSNISNIIESVPKNLRLDPGLLYAEALWHRKRDHDTKVAQILLTNANINEMKSDTWFDLRIRTAFELADRGDYLTAYKIASSHNYQDPVNYVDGEWFAGKIAHLYLKDYNKALAHFKNILNNSKYSISISKGAYWSGAALTKIGKKDEAEKYFAIAGQYPDTFYGQLAISKIKDSNNKYLLPQLPKITRKDLVWLQQNDLVKASSIFSKHNQYGISRKFMSSASKAAGTITRRYLLARFATNIQVYSLAVISSKESARRGAFFVDYSYPVRRDVPKHDLESSLLWSIIRQESEFNPQARSYAGAMGLMQLMYPTAQQVAKELKIKFTRVALYRNPQLNMRLGSHYLSGLLQDYDDYYILAIAAYNAGPHNVNKWIKKYGDPRKLKNIDKVVEWIETIPFYETRAYVQHVLSNVQIYRNILKQDNKKDIKHIKISLHRDLVPQKKVQKL